MTANEYKTAGRLKSDYWLYAVLNCGGTPELHAIQAPPFGSAGVPVVQVEHYHFEPGKILAAVTLVYETECIRGNWSVRGLKRQIASLYFERSGLSRDKAKLARLTHAGAEPAEPRLTIRDPYIFEFLGLKPKEVMSESHLEDQLLDKLQEFLLELGHGFCFEARQVAFSRSVGMSGGMRTG